MYRSVLKVQRQSSIVLNARHLFSMNKKVVLPTLEGFEVVDMEDIIRMEANDNFTNFYLKDKSKQVICRTLKFYEDVLKDSGFMRIDRSHIVNLNYIKNYKKGKTGKKTRFGSLFVDKNKNSSRS